jgi:hypothetical protein
MKKIELTQNKYALVDDGDLEQLSSYRWTLLKNKWTCYTITYIDGKTTYMHRLIMKPEKGKQIDHINHNGLDNRKENLRTCSQSQNNGNLQKPKHNTSGYKGVSYYKAVKANPWSAYITSFGKKLHLGYFETAKDAATAYNEAATMQWGNFAELNKIEAA